MEITFPALTSINDTVSMEFNSQLTAVGSRYKKFTQETNSTGAATVYPRLNMLPGLRPWVGDRVVNSVSQVTFSINNVLYESTIGVARTDVEDDLFGVLTGAAGGLGESTGRLPDLLIAALMKIGHSTIIYDGQNYFDTAHPDFTSTGAVTASPNYVAGGSTPWYLLDVRNVQKPLIFQRRRPFVLIPKFSMMDPQVFWNKEFEWGVDGRCNAGYGIWQYGYMSQQPLTVENLIAARTQMATYRRPDGAPMGVIGSLLVVPTSLYVTAKALAEDQQIPNTYSSTYVGGTAVGLYPNPARGLFTAYENEWLN
jgi:phage major head subunit gpT-like protein